MNKKNRGTRGAISVFLAMILVPCIVVSSVFVDLSRVHLSKASAESAADLALNALLTNYDADLKEWYGLVASCQNIDEFYEASANYFLRALSSQGMSDEEIVLLSDYYANATGDDTIYDLLQVESNTEASAMISAVDGANLSNAALIKDQIVEFMKYRGPIEITTGLVERLKSDTTYSEALEAEENEPLVEDKQEFFAAEGELTEGAYYSYRAIHAYFTAATNAGLTNDVLSEDYSDFLEYKNVYKEILGYVISNLSNTSGLQRYSRYTLSLTYYNDYYSNPSKKFSDVYSEKKKVDGVDTYYIDLDDIEDLVDDLNTAIEKFNTAKANFENAAQPVLNKLPYGTADSNANAVQWWVQMNNAVNSSNGHTSKITTAAQNLLRAYSKVLAIDKCELRGDLPEDWDSLDDWKTEYGAESLISTVESLQARYLVSGVRDNNDTYLRAVRELESVSSAQYGNINAANLYVTVNGQSKNLNDAITYISSQLNSRRSELQGFIDLLDVAIDGDGDDTPSLDELKQYAKNYDITLGDWTSTAQSTDTSMGDADEDEIRGLTATVDIDEADVTELKNRLVNIRSQIQADIDTIDSLKFGGETLKNITSMSTFKNKAGVDSSKIKLTNSELDAYTNTLFQQKFTPQTIPTMSHFNDSSYNVQINPMTGEVDTPELYIYLYNTYKNTPNDEMDKAKEEKESAQSTADNEASNAQNKGRYHGGGKDVSWEYSDSTTFGLTEILSGTIGVIEDLVTLDFTGMRDDLYVTTYIMEMFSYATFENEGLYNLLDDETQKTLVLSSTSPNYYETIYETVKGSSETDEGTWLSSNPKDFYNKSMTNKLINSTNNAAYCAEVEYILYGHKDSTNSDNVKSVYTNIYTIRYGLNVVSGFQHFWNPVGAKTDATARAVYLAALAVQTATAGIVPIPVTEAVLIPILTIFETSKDLDRLEAGFPVELYKAQPDQWWVSLSGSTNGGIKAFMTALANGSGIAKTNPDNGIFYSDYLTLFVYLGLNSNAAEGMYQRIAEVIQFNIGTLANSDDYSLKNAQMYFQLNAELRVKPLMITLPYFSYDEYNNELTTKTDWCTYTIKMVRGYS